MFRNLLSDQNVLPCIYRCAIVVNGGCYCCVACVFGWKSVKDIQRQGEGDGGFDCEGVAVCFQAEQS